MGPLNLTEDDEKQSAVITKKTLEENVDIVFADDSLIQKEIRTKIKEEYVEPVKTEPLEIKREDVKEEYVETEVPDFQKLLRKPGDQIIAKPFEPEEAALTTTCEHCERNFDDVGGLERHSKNNHRAKKSIE